MNIQKSSTELKNWTFELSDTLIFDSCYQNEPEIIKVEDFDKKMNNLMGYLEKEGFGAE